MKRLAFQIYFTVIGILVIFAVLASVAWLIHPAETWERSLIDSMGTTAAELLPGPEAPPEELQARVDRLAARLDVEIGVFDASGTPLATSGAQLAAPLLAIRPGMTLHVMSWLMGTGTRQTVHG